MIIAWIIGFILNLCCIWLYKNTRTVPNIVNNYTEEPILRVCGLILILICSVIPVFNIASVALIIFIWFVSVFGEKSWKFTEKHTKLIKFLNKTIS